MIKEAAMELVRCTSETTDHYKNAQYTVRTFESLRLSIIRMINKFVDERSIQEDGALLRLFVRNSEGRPGLNGVFIDDGLEGMIEAVDIKKLDMISTLIGTLLDHICGESESFSVTNVFT